MTGIYIQVGLDAFALTAPVPKVGRPTKYAQKIKALKKQLESASFVDGSVGCLKNLKEAGESTQESEMAISAVKAVSSCGSVLLSYYGDGLKAIKAKKETEAMKAFLAASGDTAGLENLTDSQKFLRFAKTLMGLNDAFLGVANVVAVKNKPVQKVVASLSLAQQALKAYASGFELDIKAGAAYDKNTGVLLQARQKAAAQIMRAYFVAYLDVVADSYFEVSDAVAPSIEWKTNPANGHQYAAVDCGTWTQCEAKAVELGGHLVSVNNAVEDEWLKNNFPMTSHYWIGATNDGIQGQWRWTSGEAFSYTNWGANLNNLGGNENCAQYYSVTAGVWNDVQCNAPDIQSAIFEKSSDGTFFQVPVGAWMAWDGSKYLASQVKVTPDYITNTMSNWGGLRVRLPKMIDGDNFKVEFRAKNDPSLGGSYAYDLGFGVRNDFSSGQKNASGIEVPTRHVSFTMTNGYFNDFFQVVSDSGDTGRLNRSGFVNTRVWHNYVLQVKNHVISLYVDGALTHQQNYSGNMGMLDTFGIGGKNNLQIDAANMSFSQP